MIIPARWFGGGKRGLDEFRKAMIEDRRIRVLHDFLMRQTASAPVLKLKAAFAISCGIERISNLQSCRHHDKDKYVEQDERFP